MAQPVRGARDDPRVASPQPLTTPESQLPQPDPTPAPEPQPTPPPAPAPGATAPEPAPGATAPAPGTSTPAPGATTPETAPGTTTPETAPGATAPAPGATAPAPGASARRPAPAPGTSTPAPGATAPLVPAAVPAPAAAPTGQTPQQLLTAARGFRGAMPGRVAAYEAYFDAAPADGRTMTTFAFSLAEMGRAADAERVANRAVTAYANNAQAWFILAFSRKTLRNAAGFTEARTRCIALGGQWATECRALQ